MERELPDEVVTRFLAVGVDRARDGRLHLPHGLCARNVSGRRAAEDERDFGCLIGDEQGQAIRKDYPSLPSIVPVHALFLREGRSHGRRCAERQCPKDVFLTAV